MNKQFYAICMGVGLFLFGLSPAYCYKVYTIEAVCPPNTVKVKAGKYISSTTAGPVTLRSAVQCYWFSIFYIDLPCPRNFYVVGLVNIKNGAGFTYRGGWWWDNVVDPYQGQIFVYNCRTAI